jgi:hypothetical protein
MHFIYTDKIYYIEKKLKKIEKLKKNEIIIILI